MFIVPTDFSLAVSISDLLVRENGEVHGNPHLLEVFERLSLKVDPAWVWQHFCEAEAGTGDVMLYRHSGQHGGAFAIDLYRGISDCPDIVALGFRVAGQVQAVRAALHAFFESAQSQVHYEEGLHLQGVEGLFDETGFPRIVHLYAQECVVMQDD